MTDEQINIRIAEACGWTDCEYVESLGLCKGRNRYLTPQYETGHSIIQNYAGCLNAMHEAEKNLNPVKAAEYARMLISIAWESEQPIFAPMTATARQRAEAFLRTLGKWEEKA